MKQLVSALRILLLVAVTTGAFYFAVPPVLAQSNQNIKSILLTPLRLHASEDLAHLNPGIMEMLSTRLPRAGRIQVKIAARPPADEAAAVRLAIAREADFVLIGGITVVGQQVSTDARLLESATGRPRLMFSRFGQSTGDVLRHIDALATEIAESLAPPKTAEAPSINRIAPLPIPARAAPLALSELPAPEPAAAAAVAGSAPWRSESFDFEIISMSSGEVDGDGRTEIVAAGANTIRVLRLSGTTLQAVSRWDTPEYESNFHVDVADINQNGRAEIFVTHLGKDKRLQSFVLEWRDGQLALVSENNAWFFRVLANPGGPARLIGQKQQMLGARDSFDVTEPQWFLPGVFEMDWKDNAYAPIHKLNLPDGSDVTDFSYGDVLHKGSPQTIAFSGKGQLSVFTSNGRRQWTANEPYGGREAFLDIPTDVDKRQSGRRYLPQRLWIVDSDSDGRDEIVVVRNYDSGRRLMERFRDYKQGQVVCLSWTGAAFRQVWETDKLDGYISDLIVTGTNSADRKDGDSLRLVMALVEKESGVFKNRSTRLVVQEIPPSALSR